MVNLSLSWPADGAKGWGAQVDANLDTIVAQINEHDQALSTLSAASTGPQGPPGPISMRFYNSDGWPARPPGTEIDPIIDVSTAYPGAPAPTDSVEGDTWFPSGSLGITAPTSNTDLPYLRADDPQFNLPASGDCTAALNAAMAAANAARKDLLLPNRYMLISAPLSWSIAKGSLIGAGDLCAIDARFMTSGPALYLTGLASHEGIYNEVTKFHLMGPNSAATTIDGIYLGDATFGADNGTLSHMIISGFRDQVVFGNNTWLTNFRKVDFTLFQRRAIVMPSGTTNTGENFTFTDCVIAGGGTSAQAGLFVQNGMATLYGCSYDYSNCPAILIESGAVNVFGGHFEDTNTDPFIAINQGNTFSTVAVIDLHSANFLPYDTAGTRAMVENLSTSHGNVVVNFFGGRLWKPNSSAHVLFKDSTSNGIVPGKFGTKIISNSSNVTNA